MSVLDSTSRAHAIAAGAVNEVFEFVGSNVLSKVLIAGQYDPGKASVVPDVPVRILNSKDFSAKAGFGYPASRMGAAYLSGSQAAGELWWSPQAPAGGAVVSDGEIAWTGTTTASGLISLRIANEIYQIPVPSGSTIEEISDLVVANVNAVAECPVTAAKTAVTFETTFTAKSLGAHGNLITLTLSADQEASPAEALPAGLTAVITVMANGVGLPDIQDTLDGMGTGDDGNEKAFTQLLHHNGLDTTTIDAIDVYVGNANNSTGLWSKLIYRPFVCLTGDTTPSAGGLTALTVITDARVSNQSCGILAAPDEDDLPYEIACAAAGYIGRTHQADPAKAYSEIVLTGYGGRSVSANRWTKDYTSGRDFAVKNGISPTRVTKSGLTLQNVITFYRPDSIPDASNGWTSYVSFFKEINILSNHVALYSSTQWLNTTIVADKSLVTDFEASKSARDLGDVQTAENNFIDNVLVPKAWIYDGDEAKSLSTQALRSGGTGFDIVLKYRESGEAQIVNLEQRFDKNIS